MIAIHKNAVIETDAAILINRINEEDFTIPV